jgi:hypothetical protein
MTRTVCSAVSVANRLSCVIGDGGASHVDADHAEKALRDAEQWPVGHRLNMHQRADSRDGMTGKLVPER